MADWLTMFGTYLCAVFKKWWQLMSSAFFTALGTYFSLAHKDDHWLAVATFSFAVVLLFVATFSAWDDEHKRFLAEVEGRKSDLSTHEAHMDLLRTQRDDFSSRLSERGTELERVINSNRPEIFVSSERLIFSELEEDSWEAPGLWLGCEKAVIVKNLGNSTAFDVTVEVANTGLFNIYFSSKDQTVGVGDSLEMVGNLQPHSALNFSDKELGDAENLFLLCDGAYYRTGTSATQQKQIEVCGDLTLKVTWRDSGGHYFFSTSKDGSPSVIQRMEPPLTVEEMQEAYAQDEAYE